MYQQGFLAMQDIFTFGMFVHYFQKPHYVFEIHIVHVLDEISSIVSLQEYLSK